MEVTLTLTVEQLNGVLVSLSKMPYEAVVGLIAEIDRQARPQVEQQSNAPSTVDMPMPTGPSKKK